MAYQFIEHEKLANAVVRASDEKRLSDTPKTCEAVREAIRALNMYLMEHLEEIDEEHSANLADYIAEST